MNILLLRLTNLHIQKTTQLKPVYIDDWLENVNVAVK